MIWYIIGKTIAVIGAIIGAVAIITSIGYGLYLWGGLSQDLGPSAWSAFVLWMKLTGLSLIFLVIGIIISVSASYPTSNNRRKF